MNKPQFIIVSGTNGVGKSTFGEKLQDQYDIPFINPDLYYKNKYGGYFEYSHEQIRQTSQELSDIRQHYLNTKQSFAVEKIISDEKEILHLIDQAKQHGFKTTLIYIGMDTLDLSHDRIKNRVLEGAHNVQPRIVEQNLKDSIKNFQTLSSAVDNVLLYDNTIKNQNPKMIYDKRSDIVKFAAPQQPEWAMSLTEKKKSALDWIKDQFSNQKTHPVEETTQNNPRRHR